jgi:adenylate kinase
MNIIFLGAPSCGKGTQSKIFIKKYKVNHVSMGELLREKAENPTDPLGLHIKELIDKGCLVEDEIIMNLINEKLNSLTSDEGILFDGFPRTLEQARLLDQVFTKHGRKVDYVINFEIEDRVVLERIQGRITCPDCGMSYHVKFNPPKEKDTCDVCGSKLIVRKDDNIESVRTRLTNYYASTYPLIDYYKEQGKLISIDALQDIDKVSEDIDNILGGDK